MKMRTGRRHRRTLLRWYSIPERQVAKCTTPAKRAFSKQGAKMEAKRLRGKGLHLYPYECLCLWWHLTSNKPWEVKE